MQLRDAIPLPQFARTCVESNSATPDLLYLQAKYDYVPVFIYGTEQFNYSEHDALEHHPRIGLGFTTADDYLLYETKDHYPVAITKPETTATAVLRGELFLVTPEIVKNLDLRYTNNIFFVRRERHIVWHKPEEKDRKEKTWFVSRAYVYHGIVSSWQCKIDENEMWRMPLLSAKDGKNYYHFRNADDQPNRVGSKKVQM